MEDQTKRLRIERSVWIVAPRMAVWRALTEPDQLLVWYAPGCRWEIPRLAAGAGIKFFNAETDVQTASIERAEHGRELALSWHVDSSMPSLRLLNTFVLEEENAGTRVNIIQEGYEALPAEQREQWMRQDEGAYAAVASGLKAHVEKAAS